MKSAYLLIVFAGLGMIFLGYFGFAGFGLALTPPSSEHYIVQYDMNDLNWVVAHSSSGFTIAPAGQLYLDHTLLALPEVYVRDSNPMIAPNFPSTWEIKASIDTTVDVTFRILVNEAGKLCALALRKEAIQVYSDSSGNLKTVTVPEHVTGQFYVYRVVMQTSNYKVYRDDVEVTSGEYVSNQWLSYYVYLGLQMVNGYEAKAHVDYFYAVTGAVYPTYRVNLSGFCNTEGKSVTVQVQADGGQQKSTPCYYDFTLGTSHQIIFVSSNDIHPFLGWDGHTNEQIILPVSGVGDHVAHFQEVVVPTYTVDVSAFCETEGISIRVNVGSEGSSYQTPHSFTYVLGTSHSITAASQDSNGHVFLGWDDRIDSNRVLSVSSVGTHIAKYKEEPVLGTLILVTWTWNGTAWNPIGNIEADAYTQQGSQWSFVRSVTTSGSGATVGADTNFGVGIYKFEATWQGITNNTVDEGQSAIGGEYWVTNLYLGHGVLGSQPSDWFKFIRDFLASELGKNMMLYGGIGVTGLGSVLFVYPNAPKLMRHRY